MRKKTILLLIAGVLVLALLVVVVTTAVYFPVRPGALALQNLQQTERGLTFDYLQFDSGYCIAGYRFRRDGSCLTVRFYGSLFPALSKGGVCRYTGEAAGEITEIRFTDGKTSVTAWQK